MRAMIVKEFIELRRDRRTLAMLVLIPLLQLFVFGYAANFDQGSVKAIVAGPTAAQARQLLPPAFDVVGERQDWDYDRAVTALKSAEADVVVLTGTPPRLLVDGSRLFVAQSIKAATEGITPRADRLPAWRSSSSSIRT